MFAAEDERAQIRHAGLTLDPLDKLLNALGRVLEYLVDTFTVQFSMFHDGRIERFLRKVDADAEFYHIFVCLFLGTTDGRLGLKH